jgi:hypothetical protein
MAIALFACASCVESDFVPELVAVTLEGSTATIVEHAASGRTRTMMRVQLGEVDPHLFLRWSPRGAVGVLTSVLYTGRTNERFVIDPRERVARLLEDDVLCPPPYNLDSSRIVPVDWVSASGDVDGGILVSCGSGTGRAPVLVETTLVLRDGTAQPLGEGGCVLFGQPVQDQPLPLAQAPCDGSGEGWTNFLVELPSGTTSEVLTLPNNYHSAYWDAPRRSHIFVSWDDDDMATLYRFYQDERTGPPIVTLRGFLTIEISPDSEYLLARSRPAQAEALALVRLRDDVVLPLELECPYSETVYGFDQPVWSLDGTAAAIQCGQRGWIISTDDARAIPMDAEPSLTARFPNLSFEFSPDGRRVLRLVTSRDGLRVWSVVDAQTGALSPLPSTVLDLDPRIVTWAW